MTAEREAIIEEGRTENIKLFLSLAKSNPLYAFGFLFTTIYLGYSLVAGIDPRITGFNPLYTNVNLQLLPPSLRYPFGTDDVGRNLLLEVLYGAPIDAGASVAIVLFSFLVGLISGSVAGYFGGWIDEVIMRITDIFLAFPGLVLAVAVAAALGPGLFNAIFAIAVVWWPVYTRIARGETLTVKEQQYVTAAKAAGVGKIRLVLDHVIPNVVVPMIAYATADFGNVIILFSVLGFLGLGAQPPHSDLGRIVYDGLNYIQFAPWYPILPGITIFVIVLAFAFLGDLVRDFLDPRLRR
ncbi:MAG: ABC transporter permease [Thermoprotei archaeon]